MVTKEDLLKEFASRMHEACDDLGWDKRGRPARLRALLPFEISEKGVEKWFKGLGFPSQDKYMVIAPLLQVNTMWLQTGEGKKKPQVYVLGMALENDTALPLQSDVEEQTTHYFQHDRVRTEPGPDDVVVEQYRDVNMAAGSGANNHESEAGSKMTFKKTWMEFKGYKPNECCVVYAKGDSMTPVINDGSVILVNRKDKEIVDGKYYALNYGGDARVKVLEKDYDGIWIKSINPEHKPEKIKYDEIDKLHIIGRVVWVGNEL